MKSPQTGQQARAGAEGSRKVVLVALSGNLAIAVTKFGAFALTRSTAVLTEALHSLVDTADQLLLLVGQRRAARAPNPRHPFGYGMETYFWSFTVALMIFLAGGVAAVWQGVGRILAPEPISRPAISFAVLGASALFEGLSFRTAYREYRSIVRGREVRLVSFLKGSKDPNVFATLLEDGAALIGLALAALGVAGAVFLHLAWADGAASVAIGLLLVTIALFLANETRSLIAGESAAPPLEAAVRDALEKATRDGEVTRLRTLHLGPQTVLVALGWRTSAFAAVGEMQAEVARLTACVRSADPRISEVLFDLQAGPLSSADGSSAGGAAPPGPPAPPHGPRG
jgi:cation diffusion facilitator family transporter